jgi:hypothetical protein
VDATKNCDFSNKIPAKIVIYPGKMVIYPGKMVSDFTV